MVIMNGNQLGEMLMQADGTCPNCSNTFSFEEGFNASRKHGIQDKVVMCTKCNSVFTIEMTPNKMILINDVTNKYNIKSTNQNPKKKSDSCYIATAVYGDTNHPSVNILRNWRDTILINSNLGILFIKCYYKISPHLIWIFHRNKTVKLFVKKRLDRFIKSISN